MCDHEYLGYLVDSDGVKIVGPDGYCWNPEDYQREFESGPAALDRPTIDVEPESVRDIEIHREIES